jgi:hypothetical protein
MPSATSLSSRLPACCRTFRVAHACSPALVRSRPPRCRLSARWFSLFLGGEGPPGLGANQCLGGRAIMSRPAGLRGSLCRWCQLVAYPSPVNAVRDGNMCKCTNGRMWTRIQLCRLFSLRAHACSAIHVLMTVGAKVLEQLRGQDPQMREVVAHVWLGYEVAQRQALTRFAFGAPRAPLCIRQSDRNSARDEGEPGVPHWLRPGRGSSQGGRAEGLNRRWHAHGPDHQVCGAGSCSRRNSGGRTSRGRPVLPHRLYPPYKRCLHVKGRCMEG